MARKQRTAAEADSTDNIDADADSTEVKADTEVKTDAEVKDASIEAEKPQPDSNIIEPVAVAVRLRSNHPHDSYGRIRRRFSKLEEVEIPFDELTGDEHTALATDIWLDVTYITED